MCVLKFKTLFYMDKMHQASFTKNQKQKQTLTRHGVSKTLVFFNFQCPLSLIAALCTVARCLPCSFFLIAIKHSIARGKSLSLFCSMPSSCSVVRECVNPSVNFSYKPDRFCISFLSAVRLLRPHAL
jgi:hypothetical protein